MEENFTLGNKLELEQSNTSSIPRTDFIAQNDASTYAVAVDPSGKLGWTKTTFQKEVTIEQSIISLKCLQNRYLMLI